MDDIYVSIKQNEDKKKKELDDKIRHSFHLQKLTLVAPRQNN